MRRPAKRSLGGGRSGSVGEVPTVQPRPNLTELAASSAERRRMRSRCGTGSCRHHQANIAGGHPGAAALVTGYGSHTRHRCSRQPRPARRPTIAERVEHHERGRTVRPGRRPGPGAVSASEVGPVGDVVAVVEQQLVDDRERSKVGGRAVTGRNGVGRKFGRGSRQRNRVTAADDASHCCKANKTETEC